MRNALMPMLQSIAQQAKKRRHAEKTSMHVDGSGDYEAAAGQMEAGESSAQTDYYDPAMAKDADYVRTRVSELTQLAEMKWRYKVVNVGEEPLHEAEVLLSAGKELLEMNKLWSINHGQRVQVWRRQWASELSDVLQGLGVARVIYDKTRKYDKLTEDRLREALQLREVAQLKKGQAETLNSLGSLKQRQQLFEEAQALYLRSLDLRERLDSTKHGKARDQAIAQSCVSLGNLAIVRAKLADKEMEPPIPPRELWRDAEEYMRKAKEAYIDGFQEKHPKVAWAMEGLAKIHEHMGNYNAAIVEYQAAVDVRRHLQEDAVRDLLEAPKKKLFHDELLALEKAITDARRKQAMVVSMQKKSELVLARKGRRCTTFVPGTGSFTTGSSRGRKVLYTQAVEEDGRRKSLQEATLGGRRKSIQLEAVPIAQAKARRQSVM